MFLFRALVLFSCFFLRFFLCVFSRFFVVSRFPFFFFLGHFLAVFVVPLGRAILGLSDRGDGY